MIEHQAIFAISALAVKPPMCPSLQQGKSAKIKAEQSKVHITELMQYIKSTAGGKYLSQTLWHM
jgi:hypothetical protein